MDHHVARNKIYIQTSFDILIINLIRWRICYTWINLTIGFQFKGFKIRLLRKLDLPSYAYHFLLSVSKFHQYFVLWERAKQSVFFRRNRACKRAVEYRIFQLGETRDIQASVRKDGWYERVVCDIEAGLSSLARCLPNTVKVHVNYRINLDSACVPAVQRA